MKKKILSTLALVAMMTTSVFAASTVAIDGNAVENSKVITENGITYIAVRPLAEALNLNVEWNGNTKSVVISNGGPLYITFTVGTNGYTIAKTAPMLLSGAPIIVDSTAYVPVDVVTDLLAYDVEENDNTLNIVTGIEDTTISDSAVVPDEEAVSEDAVEGKGVVTEVTDEEILFDDEVKGEVRLNKSDAVEVVDEDGNTVDINSIEVDASLMVEYGDAMTMSIPPLNNPIKITVLK